MNGVSFNEKHSYNDWGLTLKSRPIISPPSPKTIYINVPASDGVIDLTESMTGKVKYENRNITCEFNVIDARERWSNIYSEILDYLHGREMHVILDEDPTYQYIGRFVVNEWKSNKVTSTIVIEGSVEPYKMELFSSLEDWEWDSFNFETGIIRDYKDIKVDGELTFEIEGRRKSVVPEFIVKSDDGTGLKVEFEDMTYDLTDGTNKVLNIIINEGMNTLNFTGNGYVSIDYMGGRL